MNDRMQSPDDRFDAAMRALHRDALARISPQVRWKLRPARDPATASTTRFGDWRLGAAFAGAAAAVFAVAIGLNLSSPVGTVGQAPVVVAERGVDNAGVLDQDPDFYAWLASEDADLVAME